MDLPQDPMMLFSVVNMKLRDFYPSLDALCEDLNVDKQELIDKLAAFGFEYSEEHNSHSSPHTGHTVHTRQADFRHCTFTATS